MAKSKSTMKIGEQDAIVIRDFQQGIADSPYFGFDKMVGIDLYSIPGVAQASFTTTKVSGTTVTATIKWITKDNSTGYLYAIDSSGVIYTSTNGGSSWSVLTHASASTSNGQGIIVWKNYLFSFATNAIDVYGPLNSSPTWTNGWKSITGDTDWCPTVWGQDDILYFGLGRYLGSLKEVSGQTFAPATAGTYTFNTAALNLPNNYRIRCLEELGVNLMIGTWMGSGVKVADIFPWDRTSPSFYLPIKTNEVGVHAMLNVNNVLYFIAGYSGKLFATNGSTTTLLKQIPRNVIDFTGGVSYECFPGSIIRSGQSILFGFKGNVAATDTVGVFAYNIENGEWHVINTISTGTAKGWITALLSGLNDVYTFAWVDNTTTAVYGIDQIDQSNRMTGYLSYVDSPFYETGLSKRKRTFSNIDIEFSRALGTGQGIKIYYRTDISSAYTLWGTYDFATYGALMTINEAFGITDTTGIQLRIQIASGSGNTSPLLKEVIIW